MIYSQLGKPAGRKYAGGVENGMKGPSRRRKGTGNAAKTKT